MGKVIRSIELKENTSAVDFLETIYNINTKFMELKIENGNRIYKGIELDSILVNVEEEKDNVKISKLVSLRAFLLSKEQEMDINDLLFNIDKVMKMSSNGLNKIEGSIAFDNELKMFLSSANIDVVESSEDKVILFDGKRRAQVEYKDNKLDFNSITEVNECIN